MSMLYSCISFSFIFNVGILFLVSIGIHFKALFGCTARLQNKVAENTNFMVLLFIYFSLKGACFW